MDPTAAAVIGLNFTHLRSFWAVVQEGSISAAAKRLKLTQPTVSEQLRDLARQLGVELIERDRDGMRPTASGRVVMIHANQIFSQARLLRDALANGREPQQRLTVGIAESVPKRVAWRLIEPALSHDPALLLTCMEDSFEHLLTQLAAQRIDVIISDTPVPPGGAHHGFNHLLGESAIGWFARQHMLPDGIWPQRMNQAGVLLPGAGSLLRQRLDDWFASNGLSPRIVGEFQDNSLAKAAGGAGAGAFVAPAVLAAGLERELSVELLGLVDDLRWRFYAISQERRLTNPAVVAITSAARAHFEDLA